MAGQTLPSRACFLSFHRFSFDLCLEAMRKRQETERSLALAVLAQSFLAFVSSSWISQPKVGSENQKSKMKRMPEKIGPPGEKQEPTFGRKKTTRAFMGLLIARGSSFHSSKGWSCFSNQRFITKKTSSAKGSTCVRDQEEQVPVPFRLTRSSFHVIIL